MIAFLRLLAARHPQRVGPVMVIGQDAVHGRGFRPPGGKSEDLRAAADQFRAQILSSLTGEGMLRTEVPDDDTDEIEEREAATGVRKRFLVELIACWRRTASENLYCHPPYFQHTLRI